MNPIDSPNLSDPDDELLPEYRFDYNRAKPNRFAPLCGERKSAVVVLDEDEEDSFYNTRIG